MIKQILLPLLGVMAFIIAVGIFAQKSDTMNLSKYLTGSNSSLQKVVTIDGKNINVEIADSESTREKGLSGRTSLDQNSGMLFVFDSTPVAATFWMKGMLIPLDMIWIQGEKIVSVNKNIPVPSKNTPDNKLQVFSPGQSIDYVLEVNGGFCDKNNINVGDSVALPTL